jgi:hypothetical protein
VLDGGVGVVAGVLVAAGVVSLGASAFVSELVPLASAFAAAFDSAAALLEAIDDDESSDFFA